MLRLLPLILLLLAASTAAAQSTKSLEELEKTPRWDLNLEERDILAGHLGWKCASGAIESCDDGITDAKNLADLIVEYICWSEIDEVIRRDDVGELLQILNDIRHFPARARFAMSCISTQMYV